MKEIITILAALFTVAAAFAAGDTMNYQAVLRNPDGTVAADRNIGIRFRILAGEADSELFAEAISVMTNDRGMVDCAIGSTSSQGLDDVDWSADSLRLEVGIDMNGGNDYSAVYTSEIRSVAKSLYSLRSADTDELRYEFEKNVNELHVMNDDLLNRVYQLEAIMNDFNMSVEVRLDEQNVVIEEQRAMVYDIRNTMEELMMRIDESRTRIDYLEIKVVEAEDRARMLEDTVNYLMNEVEQLKCQLQ